MISTILDSFIIEKDKTYWKVKLNNGIIVYQDDDRPGYTEPVAWKRLKQYCLEQNLFPTEMWLTFRSHTEYCGSSESGFFFSYGLLARPFIDKRSVIHRYVCGPIINDKIHVKIWTVPELLSEESEIRDIAGNEEKIICINH